MIFSFIFNMGLTLCTAPEHALLLTSKHKAVCVRVSVKTIMTSHSKEMTFRYGTMHQKESKNTRDRGMDV